MISKTIFLFSAIVTTIAVSCGTKTDYTKNYHNSSAAAFSLLRLCVDTMTSCKPSINTENYVLDLSSIDTLNKSGVDSFLHMKELTQPTTLDDSILVVDKDDPNIFRMKQSMIIKIRAVTFNSDKLVTVTASKFRSTIEQLEATIELKRRGEGYVVGSFKVTN